MPTAYCLIREQPCYRRSAFTEGLRACGFRIEGTPRTTPTPADVLVIWNRYGRYHQYAQQFDRAGARVIVAENGPMGREWLGDHWYALSLNAPAAGGITIKGGPERWDSFGVTPCEWRKGGEEVIILAQRGIGPPGIAQPAGWHQQIAGQLATNNRVRIRAHPGENPCIPLHEDLANAKAVVTWASGAAFKALLLGIPVFYGYEKWIGRTAAKWIHHEPMNRPLEPSYPDRSPLFATLGWVGWRTREISAGTPFRALLGLPSTA